MEEKEAINSNLKSEQNQRESGGIYFVALLLKHKWFVIVITTAAAVLSVVLTLSMPNWYTASANAVPAKTQSSLFDNMMGGLSSALQDFGLTKLTGQPGGQYDFIVFMKSRTVMDSLINKFNLAKAYDIPDSLRSLIYGALDDNMEVTYEKEGNYTVAIDSKDKRRAVEMVNYYLEKVNDLAMEVSRKDAALDRKYLEKRLRKTDSTIKYLADSLSEYSEDNFLIAFEEQAKAISVAYSDLKSQLIKQETMLEMMKHRYGDSDSYTKAQSLLVEKLRTRLQEAKDEPGFAGDFPLRKAAKVGIEYVRLASELEALTKAKAFLVPMLEEARIKENRDTQSLIVLDKPILPDKKSRPKRSFIVLGFVFGTFVLCSILLVLWDGYKKFKDKYKTISQS